MSNNPNESAPSTRPAFSPAWWKIALATAVIFAAGVVTGGVLVGRSLRHQARLARAHEPFRPPTESPAPPLLPPPAEWPRRPGPELQRRLEQRRTDFLLRAARELNLRPEQRARIEQIIRESQERIRELWDSVQPQIQRELAEARERIRQELTPEQRRAFERLLRRENGRRMEEPTPPGPSAPPGPGPQPDPRPGR